MIAILEKRFEKNHYIPKNYWEKIHEKLEKNPKILKILENMEKSGGEPNVVSYDSDTDSFTFFDCSKETPKGRVSVCYDEEARKNRKKFPPESSAEKMTKEIGAEILDKNDYIFLQSLGDFDTKTSSWIATEDNIRKLGGAIFGDKRYNTTWFYHNGADSYYAARGFRTKVILK